MTVETFNYSERQIYKMNNNNSDTTLESEASGQMGQDSNEDLREEMVETVKAVCDKSGHIAGLIERMKNSNSTNSWQPGLFKTVPSTSPEIHEINHKAVSVLNQDANQVEAILEEQAHPTPKKS